MTSRVRRHSWVLLAGALVLTGCVQAQAQPETDQSGATASEAEALRLEEQYTLAGARYRALNERFAELQADVFADAWRDGSVSSELIPGQGYVLGNALHSDTRENSYYFTVSRWHPSERELTPVIQDIADSWDARGWRVSEETSEVNGEPRVSASTEDGFWFSAAAEDHTLRLTGNSPVYWGDRQALSRAIADRRDAEDAAGAPWDTTDRDDRGHAERLPGAFRPFPPWSPESDTTGDRE